MKLTDLEVRAVYETIGGIANRPFPFKLSYRLTKIADQLEGAYKTTETNRGKLILEFDPEGKQVPQDKMNDFFEKYNKTLEENASDYVNIAPIPMSLLEEEKLEPGVLKALIKLIDENA